MGFLSGSYDGALTHQLSRIERKLDALLEHLGIEMPGDGMDDIRAMIAAGHKIDAIKAYRERTGAGLAAAKAAVEAGL